MADLREAFREAACREFAAVPAEHELTYRFSHRFERKMNRMLRATTYGYWPLVNTAAKRVLVAAALVLLLLSTVMAIRPVRQRVIRFFVEVYEEYFEIRFGENEKDDLDPTPQPMVRYTLTALPDGYEEVQFMEFDSLFWTKWENENGQMIVLQQEPVTNEIKADSEAQNWELMTLEGLTIRHQYNEENHSFIWEQHGYAFVLFFHKELSIDAIAIIIKSLKIF